MTYFKEINGEKVSIKLTIHAIERFNERVKKIYDKGLTIKQAIDNSITENDLLIDYLKCQKQADFILLDQKKRFYMILAKYFQNTYVVKTVIDIEKFNNDMFEFKKEKMLFVKKTIWNNQKRDYFKNDEDFDLLNGRMFAKISH